LSISPKDFDLETVGSDCVKALKLFEREKRCLLPERGWSKLLVPKLWDTLFQEQRCSDDRTQHWATNCSRRKYLLQTHVLERLPLVVVASSCPGDMSHRAAVGHVAVEWIRRPRLTRLKRFAPQERLRKEVVQFVKNRLAVDLTSGNSKWPVRSQNINRSSEEPWWQSYEKLVDLLKKMSSWGNNSTKGSSKKAELTTV
jgi:hypothetical protein